jgi:hypothetical protein
LIFDIVKRQNGFIVLQRTRSHVYGYDKRDKKKRDRKDIKFPSKEWKVKMDPTGKEKCFARKKDGIWYYTFKLK